MPQETMAGLVVRVTGGEDRKGGGTGPLVALLHGFGVPGEDLVLLPRSMGLPRSFRFAFPEGPFSLPPRFRGGKAWWLVDLDERDAVLARGEPFDYRTRAPEGLAAARERLVELVAELRDKYRPSHFFLGGFSQGAMLTADLALSTDVALDGLVLLSGTLVGEERWRRLAPSRAGLPVFVSHGRNDAELSFDTACAMAHLLREGGLDVTLQACDGGHVVEPAAVLGLASFLRDRTAGGGSTG